MDRSWLTPAPSPSTLVGSDLDRPLRPLGYVAVSKRVSVQLREMDRGGASALCDRGVEATRGHRVASPACYSNGLCQAKSRAPVDDAAPPEKRTDRTIHGGSEG